MKKIKKISDDELKIRLKIYNKKSNALYFKTLAKELIEIFPVNYNLNAQDIYYRIDDTTITVKHILLEGKKRTISIGVGKLLGLFIIK